MNTIAQFFVGAFFVFFSITTIAQQNEMTPEQREATKEQFMADLDRLDLSEDQKADYLEISRRYSEQMQGLKNSDMGKMKKFQKMKSIRKDKNAEMKTLLNEEQYSTYLQIQEERQKEMRERRLNR